MSLSSELNKALRIKETKRSRHLFPLKDSTFRNRDLIDEDIKTLKKLGRFSCNNIIGGSYRQFINFRIIS